MTRTLKYTAAALAVLTLAALSLMVTWLLGLAGLWPSW